MPRKGTEPGREGGWEKGSGRLLGGQPVAPFPDA